MKPTPVHAARAAFAAKNPEAGAAVLMIYSMAAIVAIMLFMQLPRVAFEAQREKEQLLIDHGEQYKRAIQLYVRKFNRYPADFDALDNTQNLRFLRHKYKDPMTGKDDWRLIHVGSRRRLHRFARLRQEDRWFAAERAAELHHRDAADRRQSCGS